MNNQLNNQLLNWSLPQVPINTNIIPAIPPTSQYVPTNQTPSSTQMSINANPKPEKNKVKRRRRSRHELIGRDFTCECGKSFLSQPALNFHIKTKHPHFLEGQPKRDRGRPRKYPKKISKDFEHSKYGEFFTLNERGPNNGNTYDILTLVQEVFSFIYESPKADKLFSKPKTFNDNPVLFNLVSRNISPNKPQNEKTCDEVFTEYLLSCINKTNRQYFSFILKFVLLFRECYDISKTKDSKDEVKKAVTDTISPEGLPDLCNEFYGEFMEMNDFFGIDKNEIVEIIQHFCIWLFKNEYTKSKLSLAS